VNAWQGWQPAQTFSAKIGDTTSLGMWFLMFLYNKMVSELGNWLPSYTASILEESKPKLHGCKP